MNFRNGKFLAISDGTKTAVGSYSGTIKFTNIGDDTIHTISKRMEFYIEPSQMQNNYVNFDMQNIRLIFAEITNRPYKKTAITVSGNSAVIISPLRAPLTIRATATAEGTGSVTFYNDNKIEDCRVGSIDGTSVAFNSAHSLSGSQTFVFKGAPDATFSGHLEQSVWTSGHNSTNGVNFGHNLSKYKVRYSLTGTAITNCLLRNQVIRHYMGHYGCNNPNIKPLIINTGVLGLKQTGGTYLPIVLGNGGSNMGDTTDPTQIALSNAYRDSCVSDNASTFRYNFLNGASYGMVTVSSNENYTFRVPGVPSGTLFTSLWCEFNYHFYHSSNNSDWIDDGLVGVNTARIWVNLGQKTSDSGVLWTKITPCNNIYQYYLVNSDDKTFIPNITDEDVELNRGVGLQTLSENLSTEIKTGNYIVFQGDGELHVTIEPVSQIAHVKPDGVEAITNITADQIVKISPETHLYEEQSDGTYKITLTLSNVDVSDPDPVFEYPKPRMPEMSRVVDFSQRASDEKFVYNICGSEGPIAAAGEYFVYLNKNPDILNVGVRWNSSIGNWEYYNRSGSWHHYWCMNYPGDMYLFLDVQDKNQTSPQLYFGWWRESGWDYQYFDGGLIRSFSVFDIDSYGESQTTGDIRCYAFVIYNLTNTGIPAVMTGMTLPINAVLFHGASGSTKHHYAWQSSKKVTEETPDDGGTLPTDDGGTLPADDGGTLPADDEETLPADNGGTLLTDDGMMRDATSACCAVTTDACTKLKDDNPNLRIYVVKYRKQAQYKNKTTGIAQDFDYDYIDECASDEDYVYDAADESTLAEALADIADDVKSFAEYQAAKNVP
jgi:hypothetical protein